MIEKLKEENKEAEIMEEPVIEQVIVEVPVIEIGNQVILEVPVEIHEIVGVPEVKTNNVIESAEILEDSTIGMTPRSYFLISKVDNFCYY